MKGLLRCTFFLLYFLPLTLSFAQTPRYFNYSVEQGLPSSETYDVIQDSQGFIWIATDRGVARYNGYEFKVFTTNDGLPSNTVFRIIEDRAGRIWFLSFHSHLAYFKDDKIHPYKFNHVLQEQMKGTPHPRSIHFDRDSGVYIGYEIMGLVHIDRKGNFRKESLPEKYSLVAFVKEVEGEILFGSMLRPLSQEFPKLLTIDNAQKEQWLTDDRILGQIFHPITVRRKNGSLVTATYKCLIEYTRAGKLSTSKTDGLIHRLYESRDSCLWVCYAKRGAKKLLPGSTNLQAFQFHLLENKTVNGVLQDAEGGYWFATMENGIYYFPQFNILDVHTPMSHQENEVTAITGDGQQTVFVGYNNSVIEEIVGKSFKRIRKIQPTPNYPCRIISLSYDSSAGKLWCAHDLGLFLFQGLLPEKKVLSGISREVFVQGNDQCIYINGGTLGRYDKGKISKLCSAYNLMRIESICPDGKGRILLGTVTGLYSYDENKKQTLTDHFLNKTRVTEIRNPVKGKLLYATLGLGLVVEQNGNFQVIDEKKGLASNLVNAVTNDDDTIWAATTKGISRIILLNDSVVINNFDQYNGLPTNEVKEIYQQRSVVWLGTKTGLYWFDIKNIHINRSGPQVFLDQVLVNDRAVASQHQFSANENNVVFHFYAINYKRRGNIKYRYRLKGYDQQWRYTGNRSVSYLSLPYGKYDFEVQAQNEDHYWSKTGTVFSFSVAKPFYLEWWFILAVVVLLVLMVYLVVRRRIANIREHNRMILLMNEYRAMALASQINPHFIFNSLNSIQSFILHEDRVNAAKYLSSFARLMRKSLEHSRIDFVTVRSEMELLEMYLLLEELRFKNRFSHRFEVDAAIDQDQLQIPAMIFQPFIENSIKHGLIPRAGNEGEVIIRLMMEKTQLKVEIEDNGVGRKTTPANTRQKAEHKSHGINITVERIKTYCKSEKSVFYFEMEDKVTNNETKTGTKVIFYLPYRKVPNENRRFI